jgi:hypothetical protein
MTGIEITSTMTIVPAAIPMNVKFRVGMSTITAIAIMITVTIVVATGTGAEKYPRRLTCALRSVSRGLRTVT